MCVFGPRLVCSPGSLPRTAPTPDPSAGPPKISRFFSLSAQIYSFFSLLGAFPWNFGGVLKRRGPEMYHFVVGGRNANFDLGHRLFLLRPVLLRPGAT